MILAIDPGTTKSAFVMYEEGILHAPVVEHGILDNDKLIACLPAFARDCEIIPTLVIEMVASYGMPVGREVFETVRWIGRFHEAYIDYGDAEYVYRKEVKEHLCHSMRAKDSNIRQAIIDLFPPSGGGKTPQIGTKANPGPLYGVSKDVWAALGVAITYAAKVQA